MEGKESAKDKRSIESETQTPEEIDRIEMMRNPKFGSAAGLSDDWYKKLVAQFLIQYRKSGMSEGSNNG